MMKANRIQAIVTAPKGKFVFVLKWAAVNL